MQVQIQALHTAGGGGARGMERVMTGSNMGPQVEVAKPAIFNGETGKVGGFVTTCRLYLRMKMREATKEEAGKKREERDKKKKQKKGKTVEVKRITEEWEIWDKEEEVARSEAEVKKLVPEKFHK